GCGRKGPRGRARVRGCGHPGPVAPQREDHVRGGLRHRGLAPDGTAARGGGLTMSNTTFTEADRADGVEPDMVDQDAAPKSVAPKGDVVPMNMIQALNSALDVKMAEDGNVLSFGEDAGYF